MSQEQKVSGPKAEAALPKTYVEWRDPFPGGAPTVRIIFHGLFAFFFNDQKCFAGTHNTTRRRNGPHANHPHEYQVTIARKEAGIPADFKPYKVNTGNPLEVGGLDFNVTGSIFPGGAAPGVYVYTGPRHAEFGRNPGDDEHDWRWTIDFEDRMYPGGVKDKDFTAMEPGVTINNGLFHTYQRTHANFDLVPEDGGAAIPLNSVAYMEAADIYLTNGGSVQITGGPVGSRTLDFAENRTYEVYISNLCNGNAHAACNYKADAPYKEGRNDFFLHYETFDPASNQPEYLLINRGDKHGISDDAPCGGVGFSRTSPP